MNSSPQAEPGAFTMNDLEQVPLEGRASFLGTSANTAAYGTEQELNVRQVRAHLMWQARDHLAGEKR
jgi:hypothetical protein